jgi:hypothetical protein
MSPFDGIKSLGSRSALWVTALRGTPVWADGRVGRAAPRAAVGTEGRAQAGTRSFSCSLSRLLMSSSTGLVQTTPLPLPRPCTCILQIRGGQAAGSMRSMSSRATAAAPVGEATFVLVLVPYQWQWLIVIVLVRVLVLVTGCPILRVHSRKACWHGASAGRWSGSVCTEVNVEAGLSPREGRSESSVTGYVNQANCMVL